MDINICMNLDMVQKRQSGYTPLAMTCVRIRFGSLSFQANKIKITIYISIYMYTCFLVFQNIPFDIRTVFASHNVNYTVNRTMCVCYSNGFYVMVFCHGQFI